MCIKHHSRIGQETVSRKTAPMVNDLTVITRAVHIDAEFQTSDTTRQGKNVGPVRRQHGTRVAEYNHLTPSHHYLNAEIIYKSVKPGADTRKIKDKIITDANTPHLRDTNSAVVKSARREMKSGAKLSTDDDTTKGDHQRTVSYKHVTMCNGDKRSRLTSEDGYVGISDNSQVRRPSKWNYRVEQPNDTVMMSEFGANNSKERHTGKVGSKYLNRWIAKDGKENESLGEVF